MLLITFFVFALIVYIFRDSVVISPVTSFFQSTVSGIRGELYSGRVDEESELLEENKKLREKVVEYELLVRENSALRSQFEENIIHEHRLVPAQIVGYAGRGVYESFTIDAGKQEGIKSGMAVIVDNILVGTISKVSENISEVRTILHPEFSTIVQYPKTSARGIIRGFNSFIMLENVVITETLEKDGVLTTMGEIDREGIGIPSDLSVGKIDSIDREETASFQTAQIEPLVDYSQISHVFVIVGL